MKQHETKQKEINGATFYIRPFPAFTAAHISGELTAALAPSVGGLAPLLANVAGENSDVMNLDISSLSSALAGLGAINGDKVESLLKKLLVKYNNVSVETEDGVKKLDAELANEIFCGSVQDMFILAAEVISINFMGFFSNIGNRFGFRKATTETNTTPRNMEI